MCLNPISHYNPIIAPPNQNPRSATAAKHARHGLSPAYGPHSRRNKERCYCNLTDVTKGLVRVVHDLAQGSKGDESARGGWRRNYIVLP
jgi:hypothetical protein